MRALLILTARDAAVFSEKAATEGEHRTLAHPTGAALLGWAARAYDQFAAPTDARHRIFHSGAVRFSNALPLTEGGAVAYPMPQLLAEPKHERGGVRRDPDDRSKGELCAANLRVGRKQRPPGDDTPEVQYEPLGKSLFVTSDGAVVDPTLGSRLRTATTDGRAADGQLFGYRHILADGAPRYAATIEADGLSPEAWDLLLQQFDGRTLRLGRAANTSYGGAYDCQIERDPAGEVWPSGGAPSESSRARVWALSDLALIDTHGALTFSPDAAALGLPPDWTLDGADSAIVVRRYSPWNGHLRVRDIERQVIAAGSVITFTSRRPAGSVIPGPGVVGLHREVGLGRIWVAPPLLAGDPGDPPTVAPAERRALAPARTATVAAPPGPRPAGDLLAWLEAR